MEFPLKESFRNLYSLTLDTKALVVDSFDELGNIWLLSLEI